MTNLETIELLLANSNWIKRLFNEKIPFWDKNRTTYDKIGYWFNIDDRFSACSWFTITFDSKMWTYWNSWCSTQLSLTKEVFKKNLLLYLNNNKKEIMMEIADYIEKEALNYKEEAEKELNEKLLKLNNLWK